MTPSRLPVEEIGRLADEPVVRSELGRFYEALDGEIAVRRPLCWNRGACCRFGEYGHRLFVTTLELAYFVAGRGEKLRRPAGDRCPYRVDGFCTVRRYRPMGCRVFFCEPASQSWQPGLTEKFMARLRELHDSLGANYLYLDWIEALGQLASADCRVDT